MQSVSLVLKKKNLKKLLRVIKSMQLNAPLSTGEFFFLRFIMNTFILCLDS